MGGLDDLYQELILDHYRRKRGEGTLANPSVAVDQHNPLCGDEVHLELGIEGDRLVEVAHTGEGCSISQASVSMMSEAMSGLSVDEALALVEHFRQKYNARLKKNVERIEDDALAALAGYSWPGNIRELENVLERTILFAETPVIRAADLPRSLRAAPVAPEDAAPASHGVPTAPGPLKEIVREQVQAIERDLIVRGLEKAIDAKTVTYDFERQMTGAKKVKCSEFASEMIKHMG